jgi:hypothetical protein
LFNPPIKKALPSGRALKKAALSNQQVGSKRPSQFITLLLL